MVAFREKIRFKPFLSNSITIQINTYSSNYRPILLLFSCFFPPFYRQDFKMSQLPHIGMTSNKVCIEDKGQKGSSFH